MKEFLTLQSKLKKPALGWMLFFQKCVALKQSLLEKNMGNQFSMQKKHYIC